ncbi:MAG: hypothetical protein ACRC0L_05165, partial [Angustibacter sp.]
MSPGATSPADGVPCAPWIHRVNPLPGRQLADPELATWLTALTESAASHADAQRACARRLEEQIGELSPGPD